MKKSLFFILILILSGPAFAIQEFYQGVRQMGMGGAAIAVVNDETSLLLNPIGLGRLREPYITLIDPEVTTNTNSMKTMQNLSGNATELQDLYNELANQQDKQFYGKAQIFPSFANRNYGFGFLGKYEMTATRHSDTALLDVDYVSDWAGVMGANYSFGGGILKIGANGKAIDRVQYKKTGINPATDDMDLQSVATEGFGVGVDVGMSISSPTDWLPTIAVQAKDVGGTSFTLGNGFRDYPNATDPDAIPMTVDVALAIFPILNNYTRSTLTVELDDVNGHYENLSTVQKLHVGGEINLLDQLFFRAGYNRGYVTGGFEWAFRNFQLQAAYYNEEIGDEDNPLRDERVSLKLAIRF